MTFRHKHSCNTLLEKEAGTGHPKYFLHIGKIPLTMLKKKKKKDLWGLPVGKDTSDPSNEGLTKNLILNILEMSAINFFQYSTSEHFFNVL